MLNLAAFILQRNGHKGKNIFSKTHQKFNLFSVTKIQEKGPKTCVFKRFSYITKKQLLPRQQPAQQLKIL